MLLSIQHGVEQNCFQFFLKNRQADVTDPHLRRQCVPSEWDRTLQTCPRTNCASLQQAICNRKCDVNDELIFLEPSRKSHAIRNKFMSCGTMLDDTTETMNYTQRRGTATINHLHAQCSQP